MKNTKLFLIFMGTLLITWLILGAFTYALTDIIEFKMALRHPAPNIIMFLIGWLPAIIIHEDLKGNI